VYSGGRRNIKGPTTEDGNIHNICHGHSTGPNHDIKTANRLFKNMVQFKYLAKKVTNKNLT
jgi:hypothetical protein